MTATTLPHKFPAGNVSRLICGDPRPGRIPSLMTDDEIAAHNAVILRHFKIKAPESNGQGEVKRTTRSWGAWANEY